MADTQANLARLTQLIDAERGAILRGELRALAGMTADTESCLAILAASPASLSSDALRRLRQKAADNERLLRSALAGIRAARARLVTIRKVSDSFDTYDQNGTAKSVSFGTGALERRA